MNSLNSVLLEGNLVDDPERLASKSGNIGCKFAIATNRYYKQDDEFQQEVSFFEVVTWGKTAERCLEVLKKGRGVRVIGRLKQDRWKNGEGKERSKVIAIAEHIEFKPNLNKEGDDK